MWMYDNTIRKWNNIPLLGDRPLPRAASSSWTLGNKFYLYSGSKIAQYNSVSQDFDAPFFGTLH